MSRERVLQVLRGNNAQRINFRISLGTRTIEVNGSTFRRVADAIEAGRVNLFVLRENQMPTVGAAAVYSSVAGVATNPGYTSLFRSSTIPANSLFIQRLHGRVEESLLIHEAVHASLDLTRSNYLTVGGDEAICYIAEVLYRRITGLENSRVTWGEDIRTVALPLVNSMVQSRNFLSNRPIEVDQELLLDLVFAINKNSLYSRIHKTCYVRNG